MTSGSGPEKRDRRRRLGSSWSWRRELRRPGVERPEETRLRGALNDAARAVPVDDDGWEHIAARVTKATDPGRGMPVIAGRPVHTADGTLPLVRRRSVLVATGAALVAAASAAVLFGGGPDPAGETSVALTTPSAVPAPAPAPPAPPGTNPAASPPAGTVAPTSAPADGPAEVPAPAFSEGSDALAQTLPGPSGSIIASVPASRTPSAAPTATRTTAAPTPMARTLALYYLRGSGSAARLYREFTLVRSAEPAPAAAVAHLLTRAPRDRDYVSGLPDGLRLAGYRLDGGVADVLLAGGSAPDTAGVQQVVYTVTAADPTLDTVRVLVDGRDVSGGPRPRDAGLLGPLWILDVEEGTALPRSYSLQGWSTDADAHVHWEVLRGDEVVTEGEATPGPAGPRPTWSAAVSFPDGGEYVLRVSSPDLGESATETKTVTVN